MSELTKVKILKFCMPVLRIFGVKVKSFTLLEAPYLRFVVRWRKKQWIIDVDQLEAMEHGL